MPWYLASFPWLLYLLAAWIVGGLLVTRGLLKLNGGVEVAALALPVGLVSHMFVANALGHVVFLPYALWWVASLTLVGGGVWLARRDAGPLAWEISPAQRGLLAALMAALALGVLVMSARGTFGDDPGHASMAHLLAAGQFPLRFQCNPALRAAYAYGGNLLAAEVVVVTGVHPFQALNVIKALSVASVAGLAFLAGWRPGRRIGSGLLALLLLFAVGPMVWIYLPLGNSGLAHWAASNEQLAPMVEAMHGFTANPWRYAVVPPGFITPQYGHAHRALAWGFAPFSILLFLALLEAPLTRRRRTLALALAFAAAALLQPAALLLLGPGFVGYACWTRLARRKAEDSLDVHVFGALALATLLILVQGGPATDSLLDRLQGVVNPTTSFRFDPPHLPSCRDRVLDLRCLLLSVANLGLTPFLLPWLAWTLWRRGPHVRLVLALGCAVAYAFPFFFSYGYFDWNIQRSLTYASWTVGVLLAPLVFSLLQAGGARRLVVSTVLLVAGWGGLVQTGMIVEGTWAGDMVPTETWHVGVLDHELAVHGPRLPLRAVIFDPEGCMSGTSCRPAIVFGRYGASSRDRLAFDQPTEAFRQLLADPLPEGLRAAGYTHVYMDAAWWAKLAPAARARLSGGAFALVGRAASAKDFRALLRVCASGEPCRLELEDLLR